MAGASKDSKEAKEPKDSKESGSKKSKDESGGGSLQKRILQELTALRADVDAIKADRPAERPTNDNEKPKNPPRENAVKKRGEDDGGASFLQGLRDAVDAGKGKNTRAAYVAVAHAYRREDDNGVVDGSSDLCVHGGLNGILEVPNAHAARLGQAFSAPQKIALLRVLIADGPQSSAQLEEKASLTTGSLYHHLRELIHAQVVESAGRSFYRLTELGLQSALVLFVQAARINDK